MADATDPSTIDLGEGLEQIDRADVIPDSFHGVTVVLAYDFELVLIVGEAGVVGSDGDVPAPGEFKGIVEVGIGAHSGGFSLAEIGGLVEADDGGPFLAGWDFGEEEVGGDAVPRFGLVGNFAADQVAQVLFLKDFDIEGNATVLTRKFAHDFLHVGEDVCPAAVPVSRAFDRDPGFVGVQEIQEIGMLGIVRGFRGVEVCENGQEGEEGD